MRSGLSPADRAFVADIEAFVAAYPVGAESDATARQRFFAALVERGWSVPGWPIAAGGTGWNARERYLFERTLAETGAPRPPPAGPELVGPLLLRHGNRRQQRTHLPGIRALRRHWCAALETEDAPVLARVTTTGFELHGQCQWVMDAAEADMALVLALENDGAVDDTAAGSLFMVALDTPGVSLVPTRLLDGSELHTLSLAGVAVAATDRIAGPGQAATLFDTLGTQLAVPPRSAHCARWLQRVRDLLVATPDGAGDTLDADADYAARLAQLEIDQAALAALELRALAAHTPDQTRDAQGSIGEGAVAAALPDELLALRAEAISVAASALYLDACGYAALRGPLQAEPGQNEVPLAAEYAHLAVRGMLGSRAQGSTGMHSEYAAHSLRDRIAVGRLALPPALPGDPGQPEQ